MLITSRRDGGCRPAQVRGETTRSVGNSIGPRESSRLTVERRRGGGGRPARAVVGREAEHIMIEEIVHVELGPIRVAADLVAVREHHIHLWTRGRGAPQVE